jgi:hypothetical protein
MKSKYSNTIEVLKQMNLYKISLNVIKRILFVDETAN